MKPNSPDTMPTASGAPMPMPFPRGGENPGAGVKRILAAAPLIAEAQAAASAAAEEASRILAESEAKLAEVLALPARLVALLEDERGRLSTLRSLKSRAAELAAFIAAAPGETALLMADAHKPAGASAIEDMRQREKDARQEADQVSLWVESVEAALAKAMGERESIQKRLGFAPCGIDPATGTLVGAEPPGEEPRFGWQPIAPGDKTVAFRRLEPQGAA